MNVKMKVAATVAAVALSGSLITGVANAQVAADPDSGSLGSITSDSMGTEPPAIGSLDPASVDAISANSSDVDPQSLEMANGSMMIGSSMLPVLLPIAIIAVGIGAAMAATPAQGPYVPPRTGYPNCAAVRAAGIRTPMYYGEDTYDPRLDADHDGIACEWG